MSEEQFKAFLEAVKADTGLQEQLKAAKDVDALVTIAKKAGFDVSRADWLKQAKQTIELSDKELEGVAGGFIEPIISWFVVGVPFGCAGWMLLSLCSTQA